MRVVFLTFGIGCHLDGDDKHSHASPNLKSTFLQQPHWFCFWLFFYFCTGSSIIGTPGHLGVETPWHQGMETPGRQQLGRTLRQGSFILSYHASSVDCCFLFFWV